VGREILLGVFIEWAGVAPAHDTVLVKQYQVGIILFLEANVLLPGCCEHTYPECWEVG